MDPKQDEWMQMTEHVFKKQSQLKRAQMSISFYEQKDCEKRLGGMFHKNKPKQSQSFDLAQDKFQTLPC